MVDSIRFDLILSAFVQLLIWPQIGNILIAVHSGLWSIEICMVLAVATIDNDLVLRVPWCLKLASASLQEAARDVEPVDLMLPSVDATLREREFYFDIG